MKSFNFGHINRLCSQLLAAEGSAAKVDRIIGDGIRQKVVDKDSLPLIVQRLTLSGGPNAWALALSVLQSRQLETHRVRKDPSMWKTLEMSLPKDEKSKEAIRPLISNALKK